MQGHSVRESGINEQAPENKSLGPEFLLYAYRSIADKIAVAILQRLWYVFVLPKTKHEVTTMYEYLQALHQSFFQEPEHTDLHEEIEKLRQEVEANGLYSYDAEVDEDGRWRCYAFNNH